jgi:hypothetical protein
MRKNLQKEAKISNFGQKMCQNGILLKIAVTSRKPVKCNLHTCPQKLQNVLGKLMFWQHQPVHGLFLGGVILMDEPRADTSCSYPLGWKLS